VILLHLVQQELVVYHLHLLLMLRHHHLERYIEALYVFLILQDFLEMDLLEESFLFLLDMLYHYHNYQYLHLHLNHQEVQELMVNFVMLLHHLYHHQLMLLY
jgi:hypothetical protein